MPGWVHVIWACFWLTYSFVFTGYLFIWKPSPITWIFQRFKSFGCKLVACNKKGVHIVCCMSSLKCQCHSFSPPSYVNFLLSVKLTPILCDTILTLSDFTKTHSLKFRDFAPVSVFSQTFSMSFNHLSVFTSKLEHYLEAYFVAVFELRVSVLGCTFSKLNWLMLSYIFLVAW